MFQVGAPGGGHGLVGFDRGVSTAMEQQWPAGIDGFVESEHPADHDDMIATVRYPCHRALDRREAAEQFRAAKPVRPWVSTGRLQYSASNTVGDRFCLTAQSAGAIDALFSRGLANSFQTVNSLAWRIIDAARDDDWSTERFTYVDEVQQRMFDVHDDLAYSSYVAFRDYALWYGHGTHSASTPTLYWNTRSPDTPSLPTINSSGPRKPGDTELARTVRELLTTTRTTCQAVERGELTPDAAAKSIIDRLGGGRFWPDFMPHGEPDIKYIDPAPRSGATLRALVPHRSPCLHQGVVHLMRHRFTTD